MCRLHLWVMLSMFALCSSLFADQIVLKNGDRLTGTVTKSDDKTLVIKTEFAGEVTVQWPAVTEINSAEPLHVVEKNGQTVVGAVSTNDGNLAVTTTTSGVVNVPREQVTALRSEGEQTAYEKSQHPGLWQGWTLGANVGFAVTRGNSETKNLALAFTGDRKGKNDEITMYANSVYATNDAPGAVPGTTADTTQGGARYSHNLTSRLFAFGAADFQTNALQELNLRSVITGGLGLHVIKTGSTTLDLLAGPNYTHESYTLYSDSYAALTLGEELSQKLGKSTVLSQKFYFFPELNGTIPLSVNQGNFNYHGAFNFGTVTKLSKWLGWQNAFADTYVSNPPIGTKQNDIILTTGLNVSFTH